MQVIDAEYQQFEKLLNFTARDLTEDELSVESRNELFQGFLLEFTQEERAHMYGSCENLHKCLSAHWIGISGEPSERTFINWVYRACPSLIPVSGERTHWSREEDWTNPDRYEPETEFPQVPCSEVEPCDGHCDFHLFENAVRKTFGTIPVPVEKLYHQLPAKSDLFEYSIARNNVRPYEFRKWVTQQLVLIQEEESDEMDVDYTPPPLERTTACSGTGCSECDWHSFVNDTRELNLGLSTEETERLYRLMRLRHRRLEPYFAFQRTTGYSVQELRNWIALSYFFGFL